MSRIESVHNVIWLYHATTVKELLGPGSRIVLWFSGCNFRCRGCIDPAQWEQKAGVPVGVSEISRACLDVSADVEGVTFSGGEPLLQAEGLLSLLECLPRQLDKMLFTGFRQEEMSSLQHEAWSQMDISVEGRFIQEEAGNFLWRGSANKTICSPTGKYDTPTIERWMRSPSAGMSVKLVGESVFFYGVPRRGSIEKIEADLLKKGLLIKSSE